MDSSMDSQDSTPSVPLRSFWAIELVPGKEFTTSPDFDLHLTQAVLPASAKDKERTVVTVTCQNEDKEEGAEKEKAFTIVSLKLDHSESQVLDLMFDSDAPITFAVHGKNPVHLSGYLIPANPSDEFDYSDSEDESSYARMMGEEGSEDEDDEEDEEADEEEIKKQMQIQAKRKAQQNGGAPAAKKAKQEASPQQPQKQKQQQTPKQEGAKAQTPKQEGAKAQTPKQNQQKSPAQQKGGQTRTLQGGLQVTTLEEGDGKEAKKGDRVAVKYVGRLTKSGKIFDKSLDKTFSFGLGKREVITGWDLGVAGMKVGEKRRLVIPAELGYGSSGAPPTIPPNSSLTFEVELVHVK